MNRLLTLINNKINESRRWSVTMSCHCHGYRHRLFYVAAIKCTIIMDSVVKNSMILRSLVLTHYRRMTDGQMDGQTDGFGITESR